MDCKKKHVFLLCGWTWGEWLLLFPLSFCSFGPWCISVCLAQMTNQSRSIERSRKTAPPGKNWHFLDTLSVFEAPPGKRCEASICGTRKPLEANPWMMQQRSPNVPAENAKWRKNNENEIGSNKMAPVSFHHFSLIPFLTKFETHFKTLSSCWLFVNVPHSIWLAPHLTRNVAKFHLLHPSPGSSTGLMCLKLRRCRARSQPAHDSCGCWVIYMNSVVKTPTSTTTPSEQLLE